MMFKKKIKDVPSFYSEKRSTTYLVVVVTIISRSKLKKKERKRRFRFVVQVTNQ